MSIIQTQASYLSHEAEGEMGLRKSERTMRVPNIGATRLCAKKEVAQLLTLRLA